MVRGDAARQQADAAALAVEARDLLVLRGPRADATPRLGLLVEGEELDVAAGVRLGLAALAAKDEEDRLCRKRKK